MSGYVQITPEHIEPIQTVVDEPVYYDANKNSYLAAKLCFGTWCFVCLIFAVVIVILGFSSAIVITEDHDIDSVDINPLYVPMNSAVTINGEIDPQTAQHYSFSPNNATNENHASITDKTILSMCLKGSRDVQGFAQVNLLPIVHQQSHSSEEYTAHELWSTEEIPKCFSGNSSITLCSSNAIVYITIVGDGTAADNTQYDLSLAYSNCESLDDCSCSYFIGASVVYSIIAAAFGSVAAGSCCIACVCCVALACVTRNRKKTIIQ